MPVICPTCQILKVSVTTRDRFYSNPCTGDAFFAAVPSGVLAVGGPGFAAAASAGLATGNGVTLAPASCDAALAWLVCRTRERDAECPTPHERAIAGPAVNPINAPATAPTGPRTTAP